jgi:hypothetical protein
MIPLMTDPLSKHWRQPADIRQAPMDDTHVLLTRDQVRGLAEYNTTYPSGTYDGKCWKRVGTADDKLCFYLCWYQPHPTPGQIGIGFRIILELECGTGGAQ